MKKYTQAKIFTVSFFFAILIWYLVVGFKPPVTWEYSTIAENIIRQHSFSFTHLGTKYFCFCPPLYSFLVAALYFISNYNHLAVIFVQIIIYSLLCVVIFNIGKKIFNVKTGVIASMLLMLHPGIIFYVLRYEHSLILDAFMIALSTFCVLVLYDRQNSIKKATVCGVILGLSCLSRGTALVLLPLFAGWEILTFRLSIRKRLLISLFMVIVSALMILPWTFRNYAVTKKIIFIGAASEESLWLGNNPNASGSSYDLTGKIILNDLSGRDFLDKIYAEDEMGQKKIFEKEAVAFIKDNPRKFILLFLKKIYYFWWFSPQAGVTYPILFKQVYEVYYIFVLIGVFLCFRFIKGQNRIFYDKFFLLISVLISISFLQSLFYVEIRHRWGVEPLLLILSAAGWGNLYVRDMRKS